MFRITQLTAPRPLIQKVAAAVRHNLRTQPANLGPIQGVTGLFKGTPVRFQSHNRHTVPEVTTLQPSHLSDSLPTVRLHSADLPVFPLLKEGDKVLIGNRGTAATRFATTARTMGISPIAVVAKGDLNCGAADQNIPLSNSGSAAYLDVDALIHICQENNIRHVWPGWGFWSESKVAFDKFRAAGIYVLGPEPTAVANMGDKTTAREIAKRAGAPVVPGTEILETFEKAKEEANVMGYPVLVKAVSGGGGKGMRTAYNDKELEIAYAEARAEAKNSFNDDRVFMEKFVDTEIQHIEVQVLGDLYGNVTHFGTRFCSVQRRNQKVFEEAPAPEAYRYLADIGAEIARKAGYSGAGTVEFIVDKHGNAYFMEMNTRLQVEHGVTEQIHDGLDLVAAQIQVAMGKPLSEIVSNVTTTSRHAIEFRLIKEALQNINGTWNTFPVPGAFLRPIFATGRSLRTEANPQITGVSPAFDSNYGLLIATGPNRPSAIQTLFRGIENCHFGSSRDCNSSLGYTILRHPAFQALQVHIKWLEAAMQQVEFQKQVHDPRNPANFQAQVDHLTRYIADICVNRSAIPGVVNHVPETLPAAVAPSPFPKVPITWPLYGKLYREAGGGVAGSVAVVAAWKHHALTNERMLLGDTTDRDTPQTGIANKAGEYEKRLVASYRNHLPYAWLEIGGGANTHVDVKFKLQDPIQNTAKLKAVLPDQITSMLGRDISVVAYGDNPLHEQAPEELYRVLHQDGGLQKLRIFQGMNDIERLKKAVLGASKSGAILDICMVFHKEYSSEQYATFLHAMYQFAKDHGFADRILFTIKDAQGMIGMKELAKMKDVPRLLDALCGERQLIGIHSHNARGTTAAVYAKSAEYGFRHCDVTNDVLAAFISNAQPAISQVVQLLEGTPWDPQFPIELLNPLTQHYLSVQKLWAPLKAENEISPDQVATFGLPPGMTNNVLQQFNAAGGKPEKFPRFVELYGTVLNSITRTTGVTPYAKDAGEIALWILLQDKEERIHTTQEIAQFMIKNAASAPNSAKVLLLGLKGVAQFGFHPEVEAAFRRLPEDKLPPIKHPTGDYKTHIDQRHELLERNYSRPLPRYLAALDDLFPGDVDALLRHQQDHGIYAGELPMHVLLRGLNPSEKLTLTLEGHQVDIEMVSKSQPNSQGIRNVFMKIQGRLVTFEIKDKKALSTAKSDAKVIVANPTDKQVVSPLPGKIVEIKKESGASVKKGTVIFVIEAMKMRTSIVANADGKLSLLTALDKTVDPDELIATIS